MSKLSQSFDSSLLVRNDQGHYLPATADTNREAARYVIDQKTPKVMWFTLRALAKNYLRTKLASFEHGVFAALLLNGYELSQFLWPLSDDGRISQNCQLMHPIQIATSAEQHPRTSPSPPNKYRTLLLGTISWPKSTICTHKLAKRRNGVSNAENLAEQRFQGMRIEKSGMSLGRRSG
ncbi:hypothetical protein [Chromobacterium sp. ASV23]|uniref:hypothetical protein n=1 Tax=Chromobacterium sp. ASV23 TaxID=2795110 RepID=UPI0018EB71F9|nr:hypothetical protein [Chromobacterium sp. ASV23]